MPPFVLVSRRVVTPEGVMPAAVTVEQGVIRRVEALEDTAPGAGVPVMDVGDLAVLPGLVDVHVHINEPGRTEWEGFASATRAAAAGGVTTLVDMPLNSTPVTTTVAALDEKRRAAHGQCAVDVGFHGGLIPGNVGEIALLIEAGVLGIKAFLVHSGIDDFPNAGLAELRGAMRVCARYGVPLLVHAEWDSSDPAPSAAGAYRYADYLASRPPVWETRAIEKLLALSAQFPGCPLHVVHLAAAEAVPMLAQARAAGLPITVETAPHYLHLVAENIPDKATQFKCAPPIRSEANREALWNALQSGVIDLIASDHSPCPPEMKRLDSGDFGAAWGGIASLQSELSVVWTEASRRGFGLTDVAHWMAANPARSVGLHGKKGVIAPGADADFVIFDPEGEETVALERLHYRHQITPYAGETLRGVVRKTYLRGECVYREGKVTEARHGKLLERDRKRKRDE